MCVWVYLSVMVMSDALYSVFCGVCIFLIASMTSQVMWDDTANVLAAVEDGNVRFLCHPAGAFVDQSLQKLTKVPPNNE